VGKRHYNQRSFAHARGERGLYPFQIGPCTYDGGHSAGNCCSCRDTDAKDRGDGRERASPTTASPTSTSEPSATPLPTMTPTPTTAVEPTLTTPVSATPGTGAAETEFEYVVKTGDTLWGLAQRFGTTVDAIRAKNGLAGNVIYKDQDLVIPASGDGEAVTHVVQIGENLFRISLKYGTTVEAIAAANNIINPNLVYAGQQLTIQGGQTPGGSTGVRYHVVQPGETLWSIAMRYGTTPWNIAAANGIANINFIYAGRTLRIP
jgi:LysM repeat protein